MFKQIWGCQFNTAPKSPNLTFPNIGAKIPCPALPFEGSAADMPVTSMAWLGSQRKGLGFKGVVFIWRDVVEDLGF